MERILSGCFLVLALVIGAVLVLLGWLQPTELIARYFGYGAGMTQNPETVARFLRVAPLLGGALIAASLAAWRFRGVLGRLVREFDVPDEAWSAHPMRNLFLISVAGLFLEIVLIRWISVEIRVFAYFKNLALLACFFGFGLGAGLARRRVSYLLVLLPLVLLTALVQFDPFLGPLSLRRAAILIAPQTDLLYWGAFATNSLLHVLGYGLITLTFLLAALPFIPFGQLVARLLSRGQTIRAYSVNIAGSLLGVWLYAVVSFLWLPPVAWFGLPLVMTLYLVRRQPRAWWASLAMAAVIMGALCYQSQPGRVFWSPYQKLVLTSQTGDQGAFHHIDVNNTFYQTIQSKAQRLVHYRFPYQLVPNPRRVLLVGAGAGNDAAEALSHGAAHIDAVDIDPVILRLGEQLHPEQPYRSPKVTRILDDARAQFKKATGPYDLIVYARLDSHTLLSGFTNVRLDHYVYTRESFEEAKRLLSPDGVLSLSFVSMEPWVQERLAGTLKSVFGQDPLYIDPFTLVVGSQARIQQALARDADLAARSSPAEVTGGIRMATDDWPYIYLKQPTLPSLHLILSGFVLLIVLLLLRGTGMAVRTIDWHFFFLGAAFLLLEFQGVSRFALLFGTTWIVNTIVISAFLLMILAANWYVQRATITSLTPYYVGLLISVLLVLLPQQALLGQSWLMRGVLAGLLQAAPVFFAGIIFATSFRAAKDIPSAFASNLLGSVFGGLLETCSYVIGIQALGVLVLALYGLSWACRWAGREPVPSAVLAKSGGIA